jgi:hypothetical protein
MIGSRRGPRTAPSDHVTLPAGPRQKFEIRFSNSSGATAISIRAKIRTDAGVDAESKGRVAVFLSVEHQATQGGPDICSLIDVRPSSCFEPVLMPFGVLL